MKVKHLVWTAGAVIVVIALVFWMSGSSSSPEDVGVQGEVTVEPGETVRSSTRSKPKASADAILKQMKEKQLARQLKESQARRAASTNATSSVRILAVTPGDASDLDLGGEGTVLPKNVRSWQTLVDTIGEKQDEEGVKLTESDIERFKESFDELSAEEKIEYVPWALNQLKDPCVGCLARLLGDEKEPAEVLDKVFDDVANREWDVVRPIMTELSGLSGHPKAVAARQWLADHPEK